MHDIRLIAEVESKNYPIFYVVIVQRLVKLRNKDINNDQDNFVKIVIFEHMEMK